MNDRFESACTAMTDSKIQKEIEKRQEKIKQLHAAGTRWKDPEYQRVVSEIDTLTKILRDRIGSKETSCRMQIR